MTSNNIPPVERLITVKQAAELIGKSTHTIHFRIRRGDLKKYREVRNINNAVYVDKDEVLKIYDPARPPTFMEEGIVL